MNHLENLGNLSFAVVQEIGRVKNKFPIQYECHYSFSLKNGQLAESSEVIPYSIYRKLKLGDSIQIYRKEMTVFGRKIAVSKIKENDEVSTPLIHLERFFRGAVAYFAVLIGLATLFRAWGLQFRTYRSP
ncbi:hypothetical protein LPTSP4_34370 [Leptospira ryugenii]|uniref:Uncharacterized protein n=2 Tax=Leptospira ryugenii TaxID=1917863 RepID=A0A2P2E4V2_9LEPT|nr:hypothetical protein LPTSP4_34370 [Leptospira ryugenii]